MVLAQICRTVVSATLTFNIDVFAIHSFNISMRYFEYYNMNQVSE